MNANIEYIGGKKFKACVRDFEFTTDLPEKRGGTNKAPTPTEMFLCAFGACIGTFISNYLTNVVEVSAEGLKISLEWEMNEKPRKVTKINVQLELPENEKINIRKQAIVKAAQQCTIHNTLHECPQINVEIKNGDV